MLTPSVPAVRDGKVFLVLRGDIEGRLDANYYGLLLNTVLVHDKPLTSIGSNFYVRDGDHNKFPPEHLSDSENGIRYLRAQDIKEGNIIDEDPVFVTKEYFKTIPRSHISNGYVLFSIMASVGSIAVYERNEPATANRAVGILVPKPNCVIIPKFLECFFNTTFGVNLITSLKKGGIQQRINLADFGNLKIPKLSIDEQKRVIAYYEAAYASKRAKEAEAARLLASIDGYLLDQLGITLPEVTEKKKVFFVCSDKVSGGRFDPFYFANQHYKIEGGIYENKALKQVANLDKGQSITKDNIVGGEFPVIAGGQTSPYSHENYNQEANVITISASGAYSGYVWFHDYRIFASDCTVIRSKNESEISTLFLSEVLKLKQEEIYNLQKGSGQPHVYANDLAKLMIPVPDPEMQENIIFHITAVRTKAQQLEAEAKSAIEAAKKEVEEMIMGVGGST